MSSAATYPVATIAKLLMITERRVQQLTKEGVLPKAERGRYELAPVVQGYIRYLRDRAIGSDTPGDESDNHRRRLVKARADIAEFEAERLAGSLAPVDEVERTQADMITRFRQRSLAVAPKAAPLVAVETSTEACHEIIETFVHEALAELAAIPVESHSATGGSDESSAPEGSAAAEADDL